jgi:hypothetical protein
MSSAVTTITTQKIMFLTAEFTIYLPPHFREEHKLLALAIFLDAPDGFPGAPEPLNSAATIIIIRIPHIFVI